MGRLLPVDNPAFTKPEGVSAFDWTLRKKQQLAAATVFASTVLYEANIDGLEVNSIRELAGAIFHESTLVNTLNPQIIKTMFGLDEDPVIPMGTVEHVLDRLVAVKLDTIAGSEYV
jgi:hypothetical protein